jgi:hypothetical protein
VLTLGGTIGYKANTAAITLAPFATVTDADNANFNGGGLWVRLARLGSSNRLSMGAGFTIDASNHVLHDGAIIGTRTSSGIGTAGLYISFTSNATEAVVQELVQSIIFKTVAGAPGQRVLFSITDGVGGVSADATETVNVGQRR